MALREGDEPRLEMPATLTNTERKFIHELAGQLGLVSKSTGKGETRHINITKRADAKKPNGGAADDLPVLRIGTPGVQALQTHVAQFPPTHAEALESRETGASLVEVLTQQQHDSAIAATLTQLGLGDDTKGVVQHQPRKRHVNLPARAARHAHYQTKKQHTPQAKAQYRKMQQVRANLPAYAREAEIVATVAANPVTILQGETGCGKSTQCPQFLLDAHPTANIVVTQRT
jgi:HrpA-like RNA helicase